MNSSGWQVLLCTVCWTGFGIEPLKNTLLSVSIEGCHGSSWYHLVQLLSLYTSPTSDYILMGKVLSALLGVLFYCFMSTGAAKLTQHWHIMVLYKGCPVIWLASGCCLDRVRVRSNIGPPGELQCTERVKGHIEQGVCCQPPRLLTNNKTQTPHDIMLLAHKPCQ